MKNSTKETIDNYVKKGWEPGSFVKAFLANDLMLALGKADDDNARDLMEIGAYIYNHVPADCHGSNEIVENWIKTKQAEQAA